MTLDFGDGRNANVHRRSSPLVEVNEPIQSEIGLSLHGPLLSSVHALSSFVFLFSLFGVSSLKLAYPKILRRQ